VVVDKTVSNNKTKRLVLPWVTGFHSLPDDGGILDQPYRMMEYFKEFMTADRAHFNNRLNAS